MIKINSLWIGEPLSTLERLCMASHLKNGHEYHLWSYEPLEVPDGVILEDGNEILPESEIFTYSGPKEEGGGSVSAFSNLFRYKLLSERDGWWCDTDVVCLKPFDFTMSHMIATETLPEDVVYATTCVLKISREDASSLYRLARGKDLKNVRWGEIGPKLLMELWGNGGSLAKPTIFCPIHWWKIESLFVPFELPDESYAVHLWNEMWRRDGLDKDGVYRSDCLYENLKDKYLARPMML